MRVISGKYKGKKLDGFGISGTRPTMDRVKESLFGSIQNDIKDSIVLDLFAGTGSLGIEALSNGARKAYFVDSGKEIAKVLKNNLFGIENAIFIQTDYRTALEKFQKEGITFSLIFLDPPYHFQLLNDAIKRIEKLKLLKSGGILVCEYEEEHPLVHEEKFIIKKEKRYGDKNIIVYKYE